MLGMLFQLLFVISLLSSIAKTQTCIAPLRIPNTAGASPKKRGKRLVIRHMVLLVICWQSGAIFHEPCNQISNSANRKNGSLTFLALLLFEQFFLKNRFEALLELLPGQVNMCSVICLINERSWNQNFFVCHRKLSFARWKETFFFLLLSWLFSVYNVSLSNGLQNKLTTTTNILFS